MAPVNKATPANAETNIDPPSAPKYGIANMYLTRVAMRITAVRTANTVAACSGLAPGKNNPSVLKGNITAIEHKTGPAR